jgi:predicted acylesterase/phospholipase RssA
VENDLQAAEREAHNIIQGGPASPRRALELVKPLTDAREFGVARKLLERVAGDAELGRDPKLRLQVGQKLALCTYKDPDLPADQRLEDALRILRAADNLDETTDQETLGLAGSIYKRNWEISAQEQYLETSLGYYYRGYVQGVVRDRGYTAINAAFVLDLLSDSESLAASRAAPLAGAAAQRRALAKTIREEIVAELPALPAQPGNEALGRTWWFLVTLGEAYFGLDDCDNAAAWLDKAAALAAVPDWEQEATARQLAALLRIKENFERRGGPKVKACLRDVLQRFLGKNAAAVESVVRGKVGLALSGGGFRASFYHIGVFAKLAELDLLRHVEYLSCVSGGSIVGAHLYLEVRKLLQEKADAEITREDYVAIVRRMERDFFDGVKTNIRTQIAAEWLTNLKMIFLPAYSRTLRAGELYEKEIYSRVDDGQGRSPRWLNELKVLPKGERERFSPKDNNWRRSAKVPILVLNATALNTGHNWQFTATWMGEPPVDINTEIDANYRLRRMYYSEAPQGHERIRLGYAVGASACVPGIFEPLSLLDLYERKPPEEPKPVEPASTTTRASRRCWSRAARCCS